jgi:hypothetical protein
VGGHPVQGVGVLEAAIANRGSDWAKWFKVWHKTTMVDRRLASGLGTVSSRTRGMELRVRHPDS